MSAAPTSGIAGDYLMTLHAPVAGAPQRIDDTLMIFHSTEGWAAGPRLKGRILPPTADWLRAMPSGCLKVDARMALATDDGALILLTYGGVIRIAPPDFARMADGAALGTDEMYFITAPTFQTSHATYAWLNGIQAIGKAVALRGGPGGFVRYEIFAVS